MDKKFNSENGVKDSPQTSTGTTCRDARPCVSTRETRVDAQNATSVGATVRVRPYSWHPIGTSQIRRNDYHSVDIGNIHSAGAGASKCKCAGRCLNARHTAWRNRFRAHRWYDKRDHPDGANYNKYIGDTRRTRRQHGDNPARLEWQPVLYRQRREPDHRQHHH